MARKTVTQTFRLDEKTCEELATEAKMQETSLNGLVTRILNDYVTVSRFADRFQVLRCGRHLTSAILEELSEESLRRIGGALGKTHPQGTLAAVGLPNELENLIMVMEKSHWAKFRLFQNGDDWNLFMKHDLGEKWSIFLSEYISRMLETLGHREISTSNMNPHSITVKFRSSVGQTRQQNSSNSIDR
jgi:hypothetical protein